MFARLLIILLALAAIIPTARAQVLYGSLVGTVTDSSGAPVADARVTLLNSVTGQERQTATSEAGYYNFSTLTPGSYNLTVERAGFSQAVRQALAVVINGVLRVDVALVVGAVNEQVVVSAASPALQTDRADVRTDFAPVQ
ncbi:MAG: carboxypeptidase-like regulatory domain-containing protein, partial [Bryobacteraceae bacterium]